MMMERPLLTTPSSPLFSSSDEFSELWWSDFQLQVIRYTEAQAKVQRKLTSSVGDVEAAVLEVEIDRLRANLAGIQTRLQDSQAQRSILESVISERLESERSASADARKAQKALEVVTVERERERTEHAAFRAAAVQREKLLREYEHQVAEVESFLSGDHGALIMGLEKELAETRLALAEAESEKDDFEEKLLRYREEESESEDESPPERDRDSSKENPAGKDKVLAARRPLVDVNGR